MHTFNDIAIPISWPDQTARGDERWMSYLKRIGIVKNLNFKVGHAAILLIDSKSGEILYFDFGRYLVPRGFGRARSARFDPRLRLSTRAHLNGTKEIHNIEEILDELFQKETATHGGGRLLFSVCRGVSFQKGAAYAEKLVSEGPIPYGAFATDNNSCSRFVAQVLAQAMDSTDRRRQRICYPECMKPSPTSNVVNAAESAQVFCYHEHRLEVWHMRRRDSLRFQFGLLKQNFSKKYAALLGDDVTAGMVACPERKPLIPATAQWLGGLGEGAWLHIAKKTQSQYLISKYSADGDLQYTIETLCIQHFHIDRPYSFTYHFSHTHYTILQEDNLFIFKWKESSAIEFNNQDKIKAIS